MPVFHLRSAFVAEVTLPEGVLAAVIVMQGQGVSACHPPLGANAVAKVKAQNYLHVFYETAKTSYKLFEIRKALTRGHPVIVEMEISKSSFHNR